MASFAGFGVGAIAWFEGLQRDNSKSYFDAHRATWESDVRDPLQRLLEEAALEFGGTVKLFRPNRDIRFSKDKTPYKTNTYGVVMRETPKSGFYASIAADGLYGGAGYHQMEPDQI